MKRLLVVVLVALAGFAAAFVAFGDAARRNCVLDAPQASGYVVTFEEPVHVGGDNLVVHVAQNDQPVTGAWVCVNLAPAGTAGAGVGAQATEREPGRYTVPLDLPAPGRWEGTAIIEPEAAGRQVAVPVSVEVHAAGEQPPASEPVTSVPRLAHWRRAGRRPRTPRPA